MIDKNRRWAAEETAHLGKLMVFSEVCHIGGIPRCYFQPLVLLAGIVFGGYSVPG